MTQPSAATIQANREDTQREAALGNVLEAIRQAKQLYPEQGEYAHRLLKAEQLIRNERNFLQACWD